MLTWCPGMVAHLHEEVPLRTWLAAGKVSSAACSLRVSSWGRSCGAAAHLIRHRFQRLADLDEHPHQPDDLELHFADTLHARSVHHLQLSADAMMSVNCYTL